MKVRLKSVLYENYLYFLRAHTIGLSLRHLYFFPTTESCVVTGIVNQLLYICGDWPIEHGGLWKFSEIVRRNDQCCYFANME